MSRAPYVPGPSAVVYGWPAHVLAEFLDRNLEDHLEGRYSEDAKAPVRAAHDAIRAAAASWREQATGSANGTSPRQPRDGRATSGVMDTTTAAAALGISPRAVRKAAEAGRIDAHKRSGRWTVVLPDHTR